MATPLRRPRFSTANYWPGFVDALSTLLMVIIFLLMIYVVSQFFLNQAISGRDEALQRLQSQVGELSELLSLERKENTDLRTNMAQISTELQASLTQRDDLRTQMRALSLRTDEAEQKAKESASQLDDAFKTIMADKATIEAHVRDLAKLTYDVEALRALKADLEKQIAEAAGKLRSAEEQTARSQEELASSQTALSEKDRLLLQERELSESARAQVALLNQQMSALREQLAQLNAALEASEKLSAEQKVQITNLGQRLNAALATKVQELSRYRSEFFGRLREILGDRRDVRIVGDRFVFQSEVLFTSGSADLGDEGKKQIAQLATALKEIGAQIPGDVDWVLQIDGHTDKIPISTSRYSSNWDLSVARAVAVVQFLVSQGIPPERLAAAGFGEFRPLDQGNDEIAYRRNRRIEFKLTNR